MNMYECAVLFLGAVQVLPPPAAKPAGQLLTYLLRVLAMDM